MKRGTKTRDGIRRATATLRFNRRKKPPPGFSHCRRACELRELTGDHLVPLISKPTEVWARGWRATLLYIVPWHHKHTPPRLEGAASPDQSVRALRGIRTVYSRSGAVLSSLWRDGRKGRFPATQPVSFFEPGTIFFEQRNRNHRSNAFCTRNVSTQPFIGVAVVCPLINENSFVSFGVRYLSLIQGPR